MRSMHGALARALALTLALSLIPANTSGQTIDEVCGSKPKLGWLEDAHRDAVYLRNLFPDTSRALLSDQIASRWWLAAIDSVRTWFMNTDASTARPDDARVLLDRIDELTILLGAVELEDSLIRSRVETRIQDFNPQVQPFDGVYEIFPGRKYMIRISDESHPDYHHQAALCWTARKASWVLGEARRPEFRGLRATISRALQRWEAYNRTGRSQYPWELFLNGLRSDRTDINPPRTQWVVFHPWVGVEAVGLSDARLDDISSVRRVAVVPIDLVGIVWYNGSYARYFGASLTLTLSEETTRGGIALHTSNGISFGPTWDGVSLPSGLFVSVDFLNRLRGVPHVQRAMQQRLGSLLEAAP